MTGQILPASCTIATASGGVIDYGTIARTSLSATTDTKLTRKKLANAITVTCESPTAVSLAFVNNRYSSNGGNTGNTNTADGAIYLSAGYGAGLGFDASGNKIGGYVASVGNFKVDGAVAQVKAGTNGDVANGWGFVSQDTTSRSYYYSLDGATSAIGRVFTADYSVAANIAPCQPA
ncbi:DUF1120 domain-containing protein [Cupriavidus lacunae]|uniref:Uncharacterized protein n=1 Tax=Cupriavidus lacunae TaxID=2666307 RepID=A0A370NMY0_9BURK|nr:DUF1120 domain-containing protein [Cupriavidus lacunae]RDK06970.1 hypothetical protein DN412_28840 [Cupriavidus lacunae]